MWLFMAPSYTIFLKITENHTGQVKKCTSRKALKNDLDNCKVVVRKNN